MSTAGATSYTDAEVLLFFPINALFVQQKTAEMKEKMAALPDKP